MQLITRFVFGLARSLARCVMCLKKRKKEKERKRKKKKERKKERKKEKERKTWFVASYVR